MLLDFDMLKYSGTLHAQRERLQELFEAHKAAPDMLDCIAEELPGGLRRSQVAAQLRKLGLKRPGASKGGVGRKAGATVRPLFGTASRSKAWS